ncbi:TPA: hypothetical protein DEW47_00880 [Patescibacteria group bacterium]|nr:MAG: hypothetical protein UT71_C0011G0003 [Parcubacteria group bacterium GW2011_GWF2_40_10]KKR46543.1 MAG: hypothetical protein UT83_C0021G0003 [Parcubacteria group bacterium GW2011_GWA2_40_143]KKR59075.1 MAG: hypothetical protein UT97_C0017G0003 [Parcubacteria group bacterium GW2011_GWC2_40_31]KKR75363.1 MAG: hypothetical protein UU18_C0007G0002 [Parcubacteria group bacterium GW2011_GWB2_40_8]KKR77641.1 MAG: hypothetical protein UU20_C0003G0016 [Parcubacteria group bacterium GW2011_GWE2_40_
MKKLNPKKVIEEIDSLLFELNKRIKVKEEFEDLHKKSLQLCQIIFTARKLYKTIDTPYPVSMIITFDNSFGAGKEIKIPSEEQQWEQREDLSKKIIIILNDAREIYSLKAKLSED